MVVIDTSAWIKYLRDPDSESGRVTDSLLLGREVVMVGMVLAEVLQGARTRRELDILRDRLTALRFLHTDQETWISVGELALHLRERGAMIPITDLIIAAVAMRHNEPVYTLDDHFQRVPGLQLYGP